MHRVLFSLIACLMLTAATPPDFDRQEVIANAATLLDQRYVDADRGRKLAQRLRRAKSDWN